MRHKKEGFIWTTRLSHPLGESCIRALRRSGDLQWRVLHSAMATMVFVAKLKFANFTIALYKTFLSTVTKCKSHIPQKESNLPVGSGMGKLGVMYKSGTRTSTGSPSSQWLIQFKSLWGKLLQIPQYIPHHIFGPTALGRCAFRKRVLIPFSHIKQVSKFCYFSSVRHRYNAFGKFPFFWPKRVEKQRS